MRNNDGPIVPAAEPTERSPRLAAALDYLYSRIDYERLKAPTRRYPFGLARMQRLLDVLGNPEQGPQTVHVAGTKGKGSVSTMVAAMLAAAGLRTGLYTSPHLVRLEERFRVDGVPCSPSELIDLVDTVRRASEQIERDGGGSATFFELTTAMALQHFRNAACQAIVLEVGLGGRLNSTNVCRPSVTAITSIGLDHQHILGDTLAEIAAEKAGIIKPAVPIVSGVRTGSAAPVIAAVAQNAGAPLWQIGRDFDVRAKSIGSSDDDVSGEKRAGWGTVIDFFGNVSGIRPRSDWSVALEGTHQGENAAVALAIIDALESTSGLSLSLEAQRSGLATVACEGRVERFPGRPDVILDTAHNDDSIAALCRVIASRRAGRPTAIVFGTSRDKEAEKMLSRLVPHADHLVLTRFHGNPRWQDPEPLAAACGSCSAAVSVQVDPQRAVDQAMQAAGPEGLVIVCGSFFLAAELRPRLAQRTAEAS